MINVLINGAQGKMGGLIIKLIEGEFAEHMSVACARENAWQKDCGKKIDLVIDFSTPQGALEGYEIARQKGAAFLCGTTNLPPAFLEEFKLENKIAVFYSPNVSIGVFLFTELLKTAVKDFHGYAPSLSEAHHVHKKDAPSGTAKNIARALDLDETKITYTREGEVVGRHTLTLTSPTADEEIILTHNALDRILLARSALKVALWLCSQKAGFYGMKDFVSAVK
jgi:4-hydroxy-tetrahydrodipicolinate reductase